jgi:predicted NACHT family NTPase
MSMLIEWFTTWVATKAFGFLAKTIISEDFVKDVIKDCAKDFLKNVLKNAVTAPFKREPLEKAVVMALTEFLQLMQQDLEDGDLSEAEIKRYQQPLKQFLKHQEVKEILGNAFKDDSQAIDTKRLAAIWYELNASSPLPDDFNWKRVGKKYVQKVKEIIREIPELREILDSQNLDKIKDNTREIAGIIPQFDLEKYQEGIRETYGNLKLDSLDTDAPAYNKLKLWRIFIAQNVREIQQVLPQVYELPKEHLRRLRESDQLEAEVSLEELERHKRVYLEHPIVSVLDVVNKKREYKYIVILGDPGSGKSTLLQYLALNWAESPLNNVISQPIPLLIELRTYMRQRDKNECRNFLEFFHKCSGAIHHLNQLQLNEQLKSGNALVMFDGLDEVFDPGQREDVIIDIHRFTNEYPDVEVIVTSRLIGYKAQRLRDAEFHHFMLQDLDSAQIQEFIHRWHELTFPDAADKVRKRERLERGIATSKAITELAGNPLLLTMMAILNRNQELPRDRGELYNQASRVLLHQWDVERALIEDKRLDHKTIDSKDKQAMLRQVAYYMQTDDKGLAGNSISENDLVKILTNYLKTIEVTPAREAAKVMINQLRTRNFMLCFLGADYYAFVHRTFLEYFCAWEFVWRFEKERTITIEDLKTEVFGKHWQDESWHEVLLLIAGMIESKFVGEILEYLMVLDGEEEKFVNLFLAAKCLTEVRNRSVIASTANELLGKLKELTKYDRWYYSYEEETKLVQEIRTQAIISIASNYKDDTRTFLFLQQCIHDHDKDVRYAAVEALASNYKDDARTFSIVQQCVYDDDRDMQHVAASALASNYKDDTRTFSFFQQCAQDDGFLLDVAVWALANYYKDDIRTFPFFQQCIQDDDKDVRYTAVQALADYYEDDTRAFPIFQQCIRDDEWHVRYTAVDALSKHYKDDIRAFPIFQQCIQDDDLYVRKVAADALVNNYKDDIRTFPFLQQWVKDDNSYVRSVALYALGKSFQSQLELFDIYYDCAVNDPFQRREERETNPRLIALAIIVKQFPQHPQTLPLLRDRAENDADEVVREYAQRKLREWGA